jgi:hypothetical protein
MRDLVLLIFTLRAMRDLGDETARLTRGGVGHDVSWHAGPQSLNGQAIQDLIADGWLRLSADGREVRIDAWPAFASDTNSVYIREQWYYQPIVNDAAAFDN